MANNLESYRNRFDTLRTGALDTETVEETSFQLQIPAHWLFWSGYHPRIVADHSSVELLDGPSKLLENLVSPDDDLFPAGKPDIDVFRPPLRTRHQRGWYRVVQRDPYSEETWVPLAYSHGYKRSPATAATLPIELFNALLHHMFTLRMSAKELGPLALVCRQWRKPVQHSILSTPRTLLLRLSLLRYSTRMASHKPPWIEKQAESAREHKFEMSSSYAFTPTFEARHKDKQPERTIRKDK